MSLVHIYSGSKVYYYKVSFLCVFLLIVFMFFILLKTNFCLWVLLISSSDFISLFFLVKTESF